jgi:hypothetical protein
MRGSVRSGAAGLPGGASLRAAPVLGASIRTPLSGSSRLSPVGSTGTEVARVAASESSTIARSLDGLSVVALSLLLGLFRIAIEEHVDHDGPRLSAGDDSAEAKNLTSEQPVKQTDRLLALVIGRDRNINKAQRRVGVAESNGRDVDIRRLLERLDKSESDCLDVLRSEQYYTWESVRGSVMISNRGSWKAFSI